MTSNARVLGAEMAATAIVMIGGIGTAVLTGGGAAGVLGVALAFGLSLIVASYAVGHVSGCHINPAVTLAMVLTRKLAVARAVFYWIGQLLGAILGAAVVWGIASGVEGWSGKNNFAANGWGNLSAGGFGIGSAMMIEIVLAAIWVFVVLSTSGRAFSPGARGVAAGLTLAVVQLVSMSVDGGSANPARSLGAALFAGTDALTQLWVFIVFPLIGAVVGVIAWLAVDPATLESTMLDNDVTRRVRDAVDAVGDRAVAAVEDAVD